MEKLTSDQERQKWELQFEKEYITPVLQVYFLQLSRVHTKDIML